MGDYSQFEDRYFPEAPSALAPPEPGKVRVEVDPALLAQMHTEPLTKPKGLQCRYVFTTGKHLNIFGVKDINLDGEWYRVRDYNDTLHVIQKELVLYIQQKQIT